ncbi:MAG: hypothetical protein AB7D39_20750 [Pseudodesulfovibrio sp.]|uniref:hypothetical protein n=1 Tax=Pseudodesulfovibrio sp. TaxID=2035812 RepID=UPI003D104D1A
MFGRKNDQTAQQVNDAINSPAVMEAARELAEARAALSAASRMSNGGEGMLEEARRVLADLKAKLDRAQITGQPTEEFVSGIRAQEERIESLKRIALHAPRETRVAADRAAMLEERYTNAIRTALRGTPAYSEVQERLESAIREANEFMRAWPKAVAVAIREAGVCFQEYDVPPINRFDTALWQEFERLTAQEQAPNGPVGTWRPESPEQPVSLQPVDPRRFKFL